MHLKKLFLVFMLSPFYLSLAQQHFPGGVAGAEAWYIVDYTNLAQSIYPNFSDSYKRISSCSQNLGSQSLFNFNHSLNTADLCFTYNAALENTTSRNVFFVSEPKELNINYSNLTTAWRSDMSSIILPAWLHRYRFDLANKGAYANENTSGFNSLTKANVNFYHWNYYQSDKRFKSSGLNGETSFYIGKNFTNSTATPVLEGQSFSGNFPEFISYPFELTWNEKNRVESYLALKYGITLAANTPYRNAKNTVFWSGVNYTKFGNRIFGIGRDDISGLNQLQSESVHNKDYLIASVRKLMDTNPNKQQVEQIGNNNFVVFGDNGQADGLMPENNQHVRTLYRKWLSQNTNESASSINVYFKLNLMAAINQAMTANSHLKLWMLHDRYVTNQVVSDFTSQYVEYYTANMDGLQYGYFEDVFFDTDEGIYDQFTFGVGPEMIVQVRFDLGDCDDQKIGSNVVITGGTAPYKVKITNTNGYSGNFTINENTLHFDAIAPDTYTVSVTDAQSNQASVSVNVVQQAVDVNLGPDIVFNATQQQAILNAGQYVLDPTATYKWYKDGILLDYFASTLTVTQAGEYTVEVTSGNRMCHKTDTIKVNYNFNGNAYVNIQCEAESGGITLNLTGGVPPFTSVASGSSMTVSHVHNTLSYQFTDLPFDSYTVTSTDSQGNVFQTTIEIEDLLEGVAVDIAGQIAQWCDPDEGYSYSSDYVEGLPAFICDDSVIVDASLLVTAPNVAYDWYVNNIYTGISNPQVTLYEDNQFFNPLSKFNEIRVELYNLDTGCIMSETIVLEGKFGVGELSNNTQAQAKTTTQTGKEPEKISAKVYPNPADVNATFYYEIVSDEVFEGTVNLYSPSGALLYHTEVAGKSTYQIPLSLITAGTYMITTTTGETVLTNKIIIK